MCVFSSKSIGALNATAFDLNAACTGFIYGIVVTDSLLSSGKYRNAIVIGSEVLSKIIDWKDRNTCVLFGDGAGAVYIERPRMGLLLLIHIHEISWRKIRFFNI